MRRWMILCRKNGQLGNRLMVYAHVLAAARERGWILLNPTFAEYSDDFAGPRRHLAGSTSVHAAEGLPVAPWKRSAAYAATRCLYQTCKPLRPLSAGRITYVRARNSAHVDLAEALTAAETGGTRLLLLQGYHLRHAEWARTHAAWLRAFFRPLARHRAAAEPVVAGLRARAEVVVAIHIRHGDYAQHLAGRFFYSVAQYRVLMRRMVELLAPRRVGFLVCSNAVHGTDDFADFIHVRGPGGVYSDLHALSQCDFILGPPSSYSSWAAFSGGTRLLRIEDPQLPFGLQDFTVQDAPETRY